VSGECGAKVSLRELKLFDAERRPPNWMGHIHEGEYALFFKDVRSGQELTANGDLPKESVCLIAGGLEEALDFAQARVDAVPSLRCDIYDAQGKANPPVASVVHQNNKSLENTAATGWKRIWFGVALLPIGAPMIVYDWHRDWALIWPAFFGIQIFAAGVRLIVWGTGTIENSRRSAAYFKSKMAASEFSKS
jgi:hypothetical protein